MDNFLINGTYRPGLRLGEGAHGTVYAGTNSQTGQEVAIKLQETSPADPIGLTREVVIFERLRMNYGNGLTDHPNDPEPVIFPRKTMPEGFSKLYYHGLVDDFHVMVMDLLGPDIQTLCEYALRHTVDDGRLEDRDPDVEERDPNKRGRLRHLSLKTISMIGTQAITRLRTMHKEGVLHMDIKPANLLMGRGKKSNVLYLSDFGVSVFADGRGTFRDRQANPNAYPAQNLRNDIRFIGTDWYASLNVHRHGGYTYADDLESLLYTLLYLRRNKLPWCDVPDQEQAPSPFNNADIADMKAEMTIAEICAGAEPEFAAFLAHVRSVERGRMPNYARLTRLMQNLVTRDGSKNDNVYDWTKRRYEDLKTMIRDMDAEANADAEDDADGENNEDAEENMDVDE